MSLFQSEVKVIFLDAGGVLFDTFFNDDGRIRYLLTERGYQKTQIDAAIKKADKTEGNLLPIGMRKNNTTSVSIRQSQRNSGIWN